LSQIRALRKATSAAAARAAAIYRHDFPAPPGTMALETPRLKREHRTMQCMVAIYCHDHHAPGEGVPCGECRQFLDYSEQRLEKCPYGEDKPTCARCPIHCYKRAQREQAKAIMRYAGPRMTFRHPWFSLLHLLDKLRRVEHPMEVRRRRRN
jgi:hypothetical protein